MTNQEVIFTHARSAAFGALLFLAFVIAGAAYIVWAKFANMPAWQVTTVPLVLMLLYAAMLAFARYFRLRDDQGGDNLYYLGFLYTLTSLGVSLWQFQVEKGGEQIVTNFGVAIASTILGVALRVVFNQMRQDPVEVERIARLELADAARRIKNELDGATFEFSSFRRSIQQILEESLREKREMAERLATEIFAKLADIPKQSAEPITTASERSRDTIEKLAKSVLDEIKNTSTSLNTEQKNLATTTAALSSSVREIDEKIKSMQNPEGIIEIKLQPFIQGFTKAVNAHAKATDAQMDALQQVITKFDASVQNLSGHLAQSARDRASDMQAVRDIATKTQNSAVETQRLLTELARRTAGPPAPPPGASPGPLPAEPARGGWFRRGGS